jgi:hypothetical protein
MDEKQFQFLTRIQERVLLLMRQITDQTPLLPIFAMLHDRTMDERLFLKLLQHKVDSKQEISTFIGHRSMDEKPFLQQLKQTVDGAVIAIPGELQEISRLIEERLKNL